MDERIVLWMREDLEKALKALETGDMDEVGICLETALGYTFALLDDEPDV